MLYQTEKSIAIAAVVAAAALCEQVRSHRPPDAITKSDRSPVTIADFGAQALICHAIAQAFPTDAIVAEENATLLRQPEMGDVLQQVTSVVQSQNPDATPDAVLDWIDRGTGSVSPRFWTLDPIDGTKGFLRGGQYAVALALIEAGTVQLGVMACPALEVDGDRGVVFVAVRGQGTIRLHGGATKPLRVNQSPSTGKSRVVESVEASHGNRSRQHQIAEALGLTDPPVQLDSLAKYGIVAQGDAALYLRLPWSRTPDYRENIWDHAAGAIVVEEAGGRVSDMDGKPLEFSKSPKLLHNRGIVASNGSIHDAVLAAIQRTDSLD
ncbi:3'(2'),5'-bisphosphate nucleotidase [Leptolyngbya sp. FACHB-36]|uniref:3'(2'),5'-bisphosphate nucleotidase n=1 Tax=Leptolyngbya sp. FACHB-36 TaxID=2692808 RepID=UPI001680F724|nr:3'(2'),5'-bisphosphate nucleotidase [Leptolyngbya sp. FACHB-36]MBD2019947.1 3'(2'),5'-bisphosphate nucleotidase [Leptolyngbya sp. FACHB-36]